MIDIEILKQRYGTAAFDGKEYIILTDPFMDDLVDDSHFESYAIRTGDETPNGYPMYRVFWNVHWYVPEELLEDGENPDDIHPDDMDMTCDWENLDNVMETNLYYNDEEDERQILK